MSSSTDRVVNPPLEWSVSFRPVRLLMLGMLSLSPPLDSF